MGVCPDNPHVAQKRGPLLKSLYNPEYPRIASGSPAGETPRDLYRVKESKI